MAPRTGWWSDVASQSPSSRCAFPGCSRRTRRGGRAPRLRRRARRRRWDRRVRGLRGGRRGCAGCSPWTFLRVRAAPAAAARGSAHRGRAATRNRSWILRRGPTAGRDDSWRGKPCIWRPRPWFRCEVSATLASFHADHRSRPRRACGEEGDGGNGVEVPQMLPGHRTRRSDDHDLLRKPVQVREV
jgi:hypothetical protein